MQACDVWLDGEIAGSVCVTKEGLYTRFFCRCKLPDGQIYRLFVFCDGRGTDLGICVPQGEYYVVNKMVPSRQTGDGEMCFQVLSAADKPKDKVIPVLCNEPFLLISQLERMRLCVDNGRYGILVEDHPISK